MFYLMDGTVINNVITVTKTILNEKKMLKFALFSNF